MSGGLYPTGTHRVNSAHPALLGCAAEAERIRKLPARQQASAILGLERRGLFFSKDFSKSILFSVVPPVASQHLSLLAFDVKEHDSPVVRSILERHGWFQTVRSDLPHFTYLGVEKNLLASLGLKMVRSGGRVFWVPDLTAQLVRTSQVARTISLSPRCKKGLNREIIETLRDLWVKVRKAQRARINSFWFSIGSNRQSAGLRRRDHIHIFQGRVAGVHDVVPRCRRNVNQHRRFECTPRLALNESFAAPAQDHQRLFVLAGGVPPY